MEGESDQGGGHHEEICNGQVPQLDGEQSPYLYAERIARVLHVPQHRGDSHDGQTNPKEVEEAMKVTVVACWIKVGHA